MAIASVMGITALSDLCMSSSVVVVEHCLFIRAEAVTIVEEFRHNMGLHDHVPGLLRWMTKKPMHPDVHPFVMEMV
jgi:hypothetical protein